jgi:hypothetical protein
MAKVKKNISITRLSESALKSTMTTMSIEGRLPREAPKTITSTRYDHSAADAFKSSARRSVG